MSEGIATTWLRRSAWADVAAPGRHGRAGAEPGLRLTLRDEVALATVIVAEACEDALARVLADRYGWSLPSAGTAALLDEEGLIWSAPGQWLAIAANRRRLGGLADAVKGLASVTDQSDSRAIVRIAGPDARQALSKGVAVDLHPRAFRTGDTAVTSIAHMGAQIWQRDASPTYDLAVARSLAGSFWSWLGDAASEFGYEVSPQA